jgi:hypothetical protein
MVGGKLQLRMVGLDLKYTYFELSPASVTLHEGVVIEPATSNVYTAQESEGETTAGFSFTQGCQLAVGSTNPFSGSGDLMFVTDATIGSKRLMFPFKDVPAGTYQALVRLRADAPCTTTITLYDGTNRTEARYAGMTQDWMLFLSEPITLSSAGHIRMDIDRYQYGPQSNSLYVDTAMLSRGPLTNWQMGGQPRAAEQSSYALDVDQTWTNTFTIVPFERSGHLAGLASQPLLVRGWYVDAANYMELSFDPADSRFKLKPTVAGVALPTIQTRSLVWQADAALDVMVRYVSGKAYLSVYSGKDADIAAAGNVPSQFGSAQMTVKTGSASAATFLPMTLTDDNWLSGPAGEVPPRVSLVTYRNDPVKISAIQSVMFTFDQDVGASLSADDLVLDNSYGLSIPATAMSLQYDALTHVAKWTFPGLAGGVLPDGNYYASLRSAGVTDAAGRLLDGNGDGVGGDDFKFYLPMDRLEADFDGDGTIAPHDVDILFAAVNAGSQQSQYDLNFDGAVNLLDVNTMVSQYLHTRSGDTNLDGNVNLADLVNLAVRYGKTATWAHGDFNGDGRVDLQDLVELADNYGFSRDSLAAPSGPTPWLTGLTSPLVGNPVGDTQHDDPLLIPVVTVDPLTTNVVSPAISGTVDDPAATVTVTVNGAPYPAVNNGDGSWTLSADQIAPLAEGVYDVAATALNAAGHSGSDTTNNELVIDLTAPTITVSASYTNVVSPSLTGTVDDPAATVTVTVNGTPYPAVNNGDGSWTLLAGQIASLAEGVYDVAATATDAAGNSGSDATANELAVDLTAPKVTVSTSRTNVVSPALSGTVDDPAATVTVTVKGTPYIAVNNGNGSWTLLAGQIASLAEGVYDVSATATDAAGNSGSDATANELVIDRTAPKVQ